MEGTKEQIKLLGMWASPFVHRVQIALNLKGISYEYIEQDLRNKSQLLLESNPIHKLVPILIHDNKIICESVIILEYIDEVWHGTSPELLPSDPYERAIVRFWASYIDDKLAPSLRAILTAQTDDAIQEATKQSWSSLELLEQSFNLLFFSRNKDSIAFLDIVLGSQIGWIKTLEKLAGVELLDETKFPLLTDWAKRFCDVDCVQGVIAEVDKLETYGKLLQAMMKSSTTAKVK